MFALVLTLTFLNNMKLLIITQTVDAEDPVLGFFVRWIEEFARTTRSLAVPSRSLWRRRGEVEKKAKQHLAQLLR